MRRLALTALVFIMGAATNAALLIWRPSAAGAPASESIVVPARSAAEPPSIPPPPAVPSHAETMPPLTFEVETTRVRGGRTQRIAQTFVRSAGRIRVLPDGGRQEWLFVQNVSYRDRVSGYLIDHVTRQIRLYDESPLRSELGIRGWMDIVAARFDRAKLAALRDTGERQQAHGTTFARYLGARPTEDGVVEVWWGESLLLPLSFTVRDAGTESISVVRKLTLGADEAALAAPSTRFPTYQRLDAGDADRH